MRLLVSMSLFDEKMKFGFYRLRDVAGETREFAISDGKGGVHEFSAFVLWTQDFMKDNYIADSMGAYFATVLCTFDEQDLPRIPTEGEYLESPRHVKYEIADIKKNRTAITTGVIIGSGIITLSLLKKTIKGFR